MAANQRWIVMSIIMMGNSHLVLYRNSGREYKRQPGELSTRGVRELPYFQD